MKHILLAAVSMLAIASVSCKKTYSCDCTTTTTVSIPGFGSIPVVTKSNEAYSAKMTKKQAQAACDHEAITIESMEKDVIAKDTSGLDITASTKCKIE